MCEAETQNQVEGRKDHHPETTGPSLSGLWPARWPEESLPCFPSQELQLMKGGPGSPPEPLRGGDEVGDKVRFRTGSGTSRDQLENNRDLPAFDSMLLAPRCC